MTSLIILFVKEVKFAKQSRIRKTLKKQTKNICMYILKADNINILTKDRTLKGKTIIFYIILDWYEQHNLISQD